MQNNLKELQTKILEIVDYFDAFCKKHEIEYYLMAGTALGAVRHKGFIPWDDDFDVFMDERNYNKFRQLIKSNLDYTKYFFQDENSEEWPLYFCKLRMHNTTLIEADVQFRIMHQGIFIDIMRFDNASDFGLIRYIQYICARILSAKTLGVRGYLTNSISKKWSIFILSKIITSKIQEILNSIVKMNNNKETKNVGFLFGRTSYRNLFFPSNYLGKGRKIDFEHLKLPVLEKVEDYLKITFGKSYMSIPSQKERDKYPQHAFIFDVNRSYKNYLNGLEYWRKYNGVILPNTPPHIKINDSIQSIQKYIKSNNAWFARWVSDFDMRKESQFWYIIHDTPMKMNDYSTNTRNQIKKGINNFQINIIDKSVIEREGYDIYANTFQSYNTFLELKSKETFIRQLEGEWEFWGVYFESNLIGYSQNKVTNDYCEYSSIKIDLAYKKMYPSYALFFLMNNYYLNEKNLKYVNNGSRSVSHDTEIQSFLVQKFGFRKAYCKMHISYSPFVAVAIKFIYPFRFVVKRLNNNFANRLLVLIRHEEIRKSFL
jgi:lipopolysaccharide cholinephosphotransferase